MKDILLKLKHISKSFEGIEVLKDIDLDVYDGEFLTLLGPSGCGKTTILRLIGGFDSIDNGEILFLGENISTISPNKREFNTVFQSYALFPHLSVYENIAFGLKMKKLDKQTIDFEVKEALKLIKLEEYGSKMPNELSGGQQQRVAIARAIVNKPKILLLDESLSALDFQLRKAMQLELKQMQQKLAITFLFVTHDQEEALSMSDRIVVINHGIIEQIGTPKEIYENPKNLFVANFIGQTNLLNCKITNRAEGKMQIEGIESTFDSFTQKSKTDELTILIRPEDLRVERDKNDISVSNYFESKLNQIIYKGITIDLVLELTNGKIILASEFYNEDSDALDYKIGEALYFYWNEGWESIFEN